MARFEHLKKAQEPNLESPYHLFADCEEWELAEMLMISGMSQSNIDRLLKLPVVCPNAFLACYIHANPLHKMCNQMHTSFKDK